MMNRHALSAVALSILATVLTTPASAQDKSIVIASTTSTQDSGLFGHILPLFKANTMPMLSLCMPNRRKKNLWRTEKA